MKRSKKNGNDLVFTKLITLKHDTPFLLAINLKTDNTPALKIRAQMRSYGLAGHFMNFYEGADIVNTLDPERGFHRNRFFNDDEAPFNGDQVLTAFLFHSEQFNVGSGGNGLKLYSSVCPPTGASDTGWWKLNGVDSPQYYLLEYGNSEQLASPYSLEISYSYERNT